MTVIDHETTNLDAALAYAARGWRVIPVPPGHKYPQGFPRWQQEGTTDPAKITAWWSASPDHGIGVLTGAASGLWVLDVDVADDKTGDETLAELEDAYGPLPATYEVVTGTGGRHLYFAWPTDGTDVRNSASGRLGADLDVRGEGGFVVAPPTIHPNGRPYEVEASSPDDLAEAPEWVLALLAEPTPARPVVLDQGPVGDRPGDRWAAATSWADLLAPDGWTLSHTDASGEQHWVRPGKDPRQGTSATVGYKGSDVLKVFTSSHPQLAAECTYTKLGYLAATVHGGDHAAAARSLAQMGYRSETPTSGAIVLAAHDTPAPTPDDPWVDPIPLGGENVLPPFPVHVLPDWMADYAEEVADDLQVAVDLPAVLGLGALSTLCSGHLKVNVRGRWVENANLYLVVAMPPSTGKSPAYKAMCGPVSDLELEHQRMVRADIAANADLVDSIEAELKRTKSMADIDRDTLAEIRERLFTALDSPTVLPKLTIGDATPEALAKLISDNGGRIAIHSTEGGVFDLMAGRYSDKSNLDVYLQAWSGDRMDTARIGREGNLAPEALLTMVLTVQPMVLGALADRPELAGRGLTARFMYSIPPDTLGSRDLSLRPPPDAATRAAYEHGLLTLGRKMLGWETPATLSLANDAAQHYTDWRQGLEERRVPGGDLRPMAEWTGKLESSVLRAAALLHVAHGHRHGDPVTLTTMAMAITLGEYWLAHAAHVHDMWGTSPAITAARATLSWASTRKLEGDEDRLRFTVRDLFKANRSRFKHADDTLVPLGVLLERGWLRVVDGGPLTTQRNKRSVEVALHPEFSTVSARSARSVLKDKIETLSLSLQKETRERTHAQNAQNAQNTNPADHGDEDAQNAQNPPPVDNDDEDGLF